MNSLLKPGVPINEAIAKPMPSIKWALSSLSLAMLLASLGTSIANVSLPTLATAFHASFQQVQWVLLAYLLAITTLIVGAGRLGDLLGRRRLMLAGIFVFTMASIFCSIALSLWLLVLARALQGVGAAVMMALTLAFVSEVVPSEKTGRAMGLLGTMSAVGTALGPTLGGLLIAGFGWRSIFLINLPLGLLTLVLAYFHLPTEHQKSMVNRKSFDVAGMLLLALTLAAYALAMTIRQHDGSRGFNMINAGLIFLTILGACLFVFVELKVESPLIKLSIFKNPQQSASFVMSAIVTTVVMTTLVVGPFYLLGALLLDTAHAGLVMSAGPIVAALTGVPAGRMADRFGSQRMSIAGLIAMAFGSLFFSMMPVGFGVAGYITPLIIITAGYALFQTANNTSIMSNISVDQRGVVSGMLNLSRNLGLISGASFMGAVFAYAAKSNDIKHMNPDAVASGMHMTFAIATMLIVFVLVIAMWARKRGNIE